MKRIMKVVICVLIAVMCCGAMAQATELFSLYGGSLENAKQVVPDLTRDDGSWYTAKGVKIGYEDSLGVFSIWLEDSSDYTLFGVKPGMSMSDIKSTWSDIDDLTFDEVSSDCVSCLVNDTDAYLWAISEGSSADYIIMEIIEEGYDDGDTW